MADPMVSMANQLLGQKTRGTERRKQRKQPMIQISIRLPVPVWEELKNIDPLRPHALVRKIVCANTPLPGDAPDFLEGSGASDAKHA